MTQPIFINSEGGDWVGVLDRGRPLTIAEAAELLDNEGFDLEGGTLAQEGFLSVEIPPEDQGSFSSWWERVPAEHPGAVVGVVCDR